MTKEQLMTKWYQQEAYVNQLEDAVENAHKDIETSKADIETSKFKFDKRLQNIRMKLTLRDRRLSQLQEKLDVITQEQVHNTALDDTMNDPAINMMFERMRAEVDGAKSRVQEMQDELIAWKFTPDSTTGKRLMSKCRLLHCENEELGKEVSGGWVAQLTGNLSLQKKLSEEMKKSHTELDGFLLEMEEEIVGMQNTIYYLQRANKDSEPQSIDLGSPG